MTLPLPPTLPDRLPDYLPGRIRVVDERSWPLGEASDDRVVRTALPRYALDLRTRDVAIDPDRVRWLVERVATRSLASRHAHLVPRPEGLYVVDGHHALAAHLATGADRVPVKLVSTLHAARPSDG